MREPMSRSRCFRALAPALCVAAFACSASHPAQRLVLITVDTLRADSLTAKRMPRTFAFAAGGQRFERCYAASSATQPTHASLFTGQHPWEHGVSGKINRVSGTAIQQWSDYTHSLKNAMNLIYSKYPQKYIIF